MLNGSNSNVVDIYNTTSGIWSTTNMSQARTFLAATSAGNQVFFAGGCAPGPNVITNVVDIYSTSAGTWSTASLSQARYGLSATSAGNQVFFAGGFTTIWGNGPSNVLDIYNTSAGTWSTATLPSAIGTIAATSVGNEAFFASGSQVDIYNTSAGTWSTATLPSAQGPSVATSAGNEVFFSNGSQVAIYTLQNYSTITSSKAFTLCDQTTVAGLMQLNAPASLNFGTFNLNVGSMHGNAPIDLGSGTLTTGSDNASTTYSGIISDAGSLVKIGSGTLDLNGGNTYSGGTTVSSGTLQLGANGALPTNSALTVYGALDLNTYNATVDSLSGSGMIISVAGGAPLLTIGNAGGGGTFSGVISGPIALTKAGAGQLTMSGISTYTGGTTISQGTLNVTGALAGGGNVVIATGATLASSGMVNGEVTGLAGATIFATGNLILGDSTSYTGFNHAGTLIVGANTVTLNSAAFANLGVLTTLDGGTLAAPNGMSLGVGCNLVGSGAVNGKIAAGYGSTINATGNLTLGDSSSPVGFVSDGELYTNANTVTLNSFNAANNQNAVVLGSLTELDGGSLIAPNGILLENGDNLVTTDAGGTISGGSASRFLNRGNVQGPSSASSNWLIFNLLFKGSTGQTSGRIGFLGGFATGDSPGVNTQYGSTELGGTGTEFDIGGTTPGNSDNNYGQLNILTDPHDLNDQGNLVLSPSTTFKIVDWNRFVPTPGESFTVLTWAGTLSGTASLAIDPAFAAEGIQFVPRWNSNSLVIEAVPEPSTLILLGVGAVVLMGYGWRRRRTPEQNDCAGVAPFDSKKGY